MDKPDPVAVTAGDTEVGAAIAARFACEGYGVAVCRDSPRGRHITGVLLPCDAARSLPTFQPAPTGHPPAPADESAWMA